MRIYRYYIIVILTLALSLNWIVAPNDPTRGLMNLNLLPKFFIVIIEVLQAILLLAILIKYYKFHPFIQKTIILIGIFSAFQLVLTFASGSSVLNWISGLRYYFSFLPLFLLSYILGYKGYEIRREFNFLLSFILIQIPIAIWQFTQLSNIIYEGTKFDLVVGTMGGLGTNLLSSVLSIALLYFLLKYFNEQKVKYLFFAFITIIPSALSEAKGVFIIIFIVIIFLLIQFRVGVSKIFKLSLILILLLAGFLYFYSLLGYDQKRDLLNLDYLISYETADRTNDRRLSRTQSVEYAINLVFNEGSPIWGMGIGSANSNPIGPDGKYFDFFTIRHNIDILITEVGLLGFLILIYLIVRLYIIGRKVVYISLVQRNNFNTLISRLLLGLIFTSLFCMLWTDILFRVQFMYPFGLLAGYILGTYKKYKSKNKNKFYLKYEALNNYSI